MSALRRASCRWAPKNTAKKKAKIRYGVYRCAICNGETKAKDVKLDHINPVVDPATGWVSYDSFISRLFVEADGYQVLCVGCHHELTQKQNKQRKDAKTYRAVEDIEETR